MYLLAGLFKETGMAFIVYVCVNLFFGINTIITHSVVFLLSQEKATDQVGAPQVLTLWWHCRRLLVGLVALIRSIAAGHSHSISWSTLQTGHESHGSCLSVNLPPQQRRRWWSQREGHEKKGRKLRPLFITTLVMEGRRWWRCLIRSCWWTLQTIAEFLQHELWGVTTEYHCPESDTCCS